MKRPTLAAVILLALAALAWAIRWQYIPASISGAPALYRINRYTGRAELSLGVGPFKPIETAPPAE